MIQTPAKFELEDGVTEEIKELAKVFRNAIERSDRVRLPITLLNFPRGSCGDAIIMLGAYLDEQGIQPLIYVGGQRGEKSHAWLESDGLIIDITADQFDDCDEPVIVTRESEWHSTFERDFESEASFINYDPATVNRLARPYEEILRRT